MKAHYDSIHGRIASEWRRTEGRFELSVEIPANTTATIYLPAKSADAIRVGWRALAQAKGVKYLRMEKDDAVLVVESGNYHFASKL